MSSSILARTSAAAKQISQLPPIIFGLLALTLLVGCATNPSPRSGLPPTGAAAMQPAPTRLELASGQPMLASMPNPAPATAPTSGPLAVGLLLPLSGPQAALGQAMSNAAQLAVFASGAPVQLLPRDSTMTPEGATNAAQALLADGVKVVVGPLFAPQVRAVGQVTRAANVPLLALASDPSVASPGVYLLGFNPGQQASRVLDYAKQQGLSSYLALLPGNNLGGMLAQTLQQQAGNAAKVIYYRPDGGDLNAKIAELVALATPDAVLVAEPRAARALAAHWVANPPADRPVPVLLGTAAFEEIEDAAWPFAIRLWFAAASNGPRAAFEREYAKNFGGPPPRLASLGYDATALVGALASLGRPLVANWLEQPAGFTGVDGVFRLMANGLTERQLVVWEWQHSRKTQMDERQGF